MKRKCYRLISLLIIVTLSTNSLIQASNHLGSLSEVSSQNIIRNELIDLGHAYLNVSDSYIELFDTGGQLFAYAYKLSNYQTTAGYAIVNILSTPNSVIATSVGEQASQLIDYLFSNDNLLYTYRFPFTFICNSPAGKYYIDQSESANISLVPITISSSSDNIVDILSSTSFSAYPQSLNVSRDIQFAALSNWQQGSFVPVTQGTTTYYGAKQQWLADYGYMSQGLADRACGVSAAANALHYLSENKTGKSNLYDYPSTQRSLFTAFMNDVSLYVTPTLIGIPTASIVADGVENFASSQHVSLTSTQINLSSFSNATNGVRNALDDDCPVLLLSWDSPIPDLPFHWVTITRLYTNNNGRFMITTSNWGNMESYDFQLWYETTFLNKSLIYFS